MHNRGLSSRQATPLLSTVREKVGKMSKKNKKLKVTSLVQLEDEAPEDGILERMVLDYYRSGADCETTLRDNRASYARFKIIPRMLRDVSNISMAVSLCGVLSIFHIQHAAAALAMASAVVTSLSS